MSPYRYQKIFFQTKKLYSKIGIIQCPALQNEPVHFNSIGFDHMIRKGRFSRPIEDQIRRFNLLPFALDVIKHGKLVDYRIIQKTVKTKRNKEKIEKNMIIRFWTLVYLNDRRNIKVVIIKKGNGQKNYLSIM